MNWDTNETWTWITNELKYKVLLEPWIGNELLFISTLVDIINDINNQLANENRITHANVNGNELYVRFCELCGNEQEGWK